MSCQIGLEREFLVADMTLVHHGSLIIHAPETQIIKKVNMKTSISFAYEYILLTSFKILTTISIKGYVIY